MKPAISGYSAYNDFAYSSVDRDLDTHVRFVENKNGWLIIDLLERYRISYLIIIYEGKKYNLKYFLYITNTFRSGSTENVCHDKMYFFQCFTILFN